MASRCQIRTLAAGEELGDEDRAGSAAALPLSHLRGRRTSASWHVCTGKWKRAWPSFGRPHLGDLIQETCFGLSELSRRLMDDALSPEIKRYSGASSSTFGEENLLRRDRSCPLLVRRLGVTRTLGGRGLCESGPLRPRPPPSSLCGGARTVTAWGLGGVSPRLRHLFSSVG